MLWIVIALLFILISVRSDDVDRPLPNDKLKIHNTEELFIEANNAFAIHLYKYLASTDGNIFFCAACVSSSLAMLMHTSTKSTAAELNKSLQFKKAKLNSTEIQNQFIKLNDRMKTTECLAQFTNILFVQKGYEMLSDFAEDAKHMYNTDIVETDFSGNLQQAVWDVNESIKTKTHGRIKRLFERMNSKNSMLLVNAASFKTKFTNVFDKDISLKESFYNHGFQDHNIEVFVMAKNNAVQRIATSYDFRALELPCGEADNSTIKLWIFLPHKIGSLPDVEYGLSTVTFEQIQNSFENIITNITLPRLRFDFSRDISKDLQKLGIRKAFQEDADFSSVSDTNGLHLSQVLQRAILEISENGFEPFSASDFLPQDIDFEGTTSSSSMYVPPFKANHPFLFSIVDSKSGLILYLGRVFEF